MRLHSASDGSFAATSVPPGEVELLVHASGHAPYTQFFSLRADTVNTVTVELQQGATLGGRVVDEAGSPIAGAGVEISSFGYVLETYTKSNRDGRFDLQALDSRRIEIRIRARGFAPLLETHTASPGERLERTLTMRRIGTLKGRVLGPNGKPLGSWIVMIHDGVMRTVETNPERRIRGPNRRTKRGPQRLSTSPETLSQV